MAESGLLDRGISGVSATTRNEESETVGHGRVYRSVKRLGLWSGILATIWTVWFIGAFGPYMATMPVWNGIDAWARDFQALPYVAWVIPCLFLALTFPVLLICVHFATAWDRQIWSAIGLAFGVMYGAVLTTNYWLLLGHVRESLLRHDTEGLYRLVIGSPGSVTNAIEGIGYCFMGLATLFSGFAFGGSRRDSWIRWILVVNGIAGLAGVVVGLLGNMPLTMVSLAVWCVTFPVGTGLVADHFRRRGVIS